MAMRKEAYVQYQNPEPVPQRPRNKPLLSSVVFQQCIYFNIVYTLPYALLQILLFAWKYKNASGWRVEYVTPIIMILYIIVEPARLYLGWSGNLREQVPQYAAFLFLTTFICPVFIIYNIRFQEPVTGLDKALAWVYMCFVAGGFLFGFMGIRRIIAHRTLRFSVEHYAHAFDNSSNYEGFVNVGSASADGRRAVVSSPGEITNGNSSYQAGVPTAGSTYTSMTRPTSTTSAIDGGGGGGGMGGEAGSRGWFDTQYQQQHQLHSPSYPSETAYSTGATGGPGYNIGSRTPNLAVSRRGPAPDDYPRSFGA